MRISDWSSDVCSSDLFDKPSTNGRTGDLVRAALDAPQQGEAGLADAALGVDLETGYLDSLLFRGFDGDPAFGADPAAAGELFARDAAAAGAIGGVRPDERRVGTGCGSASRSRWGPEHYKKK